MRQFCDCDVVAAKGDFRLTFIAGGGSNGILKAVLMANTTMASTQRSSSASSLAGPAPNVPAVNMEHIDDQFEVITPIATLAMNF